MHERRIWRIVVVLLAAAAFGVAVSAFKGNGAGFRDELGNVSAPWLLLPFFAGAAVRGRAAAGAVVGLAATLVALVAFYVTNALVLDLGPHTFLVDLRLTLGATAYWVPRGLLSGPVFGALGAAWRRRGYPVLGVAVLLLLVAEPVFWLVAHRGGGVGNYDFAPSPAVSLAEALVGLAGAICAAVLVRRTHRRAAL